MNEDFQITLNSLQHYIFCPFSWSLIFGQGEWAENSRTVSGHLFHEKVHDDSFDEKRSAKYSVRGMPLFHRSYRLTGIADLVEFIPNEKNGVFIRGVNKKCRPVVIEYKVGKPVNNEIREADAVQLASQMLCVEDMFGTPCEGFIYYKTVNRRLRLVDYEAKKALLIQSIREIEQFASSGLFPVMRAKEGCRGCSLADICIPKCKCGNTRETIRKEWEKACNEKIT